MSSAGFSNLVAFKSNIRKVQKGLLPEVGRALVEELEATELPLVIDNTPILTGALRSTEHVEGPELKGDQVSAQIVAGGPDAPYAPIVHENMNAHHNIGRAKFVEAVMDENSNTLMARVGARVNLGNTLE